MKKIYLIFSLTFIIINYLSSQNNESVVKPDTSDYPYWVDMMQDPNANYYETVRAFNIFWQDREITRSCGWKPFKRWEWLMQFRIFPNGDRRPPDYDKRKMSEFLNNNPPSRDFAGDWTNLGPFDLPLPAKGYQGLGRINDVEFHPTDPDIIYIGAPSGGLWKTTDCGDNWSSTTDGLSTLGVSSIIVDYNNPDNVYIGTGDRDHGDAPGLGVMKSTDAGQTWSDASTGMGNTTVGRMIQHPDNPQTILAATEGGIYKTTDGAQNWSFKEGGNFKEIVYKPDDPSVVYASKNGSFYKSTDTGETCTKITSGLSGGNRGVIAVTPDNPDVVYFLVTYWDSFKAFYKSVDEGENFTMQSDSPNIMSWGCNGGSGGQAWYDLDVTVDPNNENIIYAGGVNCFKSTDGGVTWQINSHWWGDCGVPAVHADLHGVEWNPLDGRLYAVNDGGIYWTDNGGTTWTEITEGLPISQVYKIGVSATSRILAINGYQDNGTSTYTGSEWLNVIGGDGMECAVDYTDSTITYGTLYFGDIFRITNNHNSYKVAGYGVHGIDESGAWITPFTLHQDKPNVMFVGYKNIWRCENVKEYNPTWKKISDALSGSNSENMRVVEHSPADPGLLYAARYDNKLYRSDDVMADNPSWLNLTSALPSKDITPADIEAHPDNPDIVYMVYDTSVYKSTDRGQSWEDISDNLPGISFNTIEYYTNSDDGLYVGSNNGIFYKDNNMDDWVLFTDGFPEAATVTEIEIYTDANDISRDLVKAGTYGRGLWQTIPYYYSPGADFYASDTNLPVGCSIDFFDASGGIPHKYSWTFEGAIPCSSTERNPCGILYETEGTFEVKLTVSNPEGTDSITKINYITVDSAMLPTVDFSTCDSVICIGEAVEFIDKSSNCPTNWLWEFSPNTINFIDGTDKNSQHPVVEFTGGGSFDVTLTVTNNAGSKSLTKEGYIHSGGFPIPFEEDFETGSLSDGLWTIDNPDFDITWGIDSVGGTSPGSYAAWIELFYYDNFQALDRLISPALDFSGFDKVYLHFEHAYTLRYNLKDSLVVYVSDDCGNSWQRVFAAGPDGEGSFGTHPNTPDYFVPETSEDWCGEGYGADCFTIDLSQLAGMNEIKIAFESFNYHGNNLFIDNVTVSNTTVTYEFAVEDQDFTIIPNPTSGYFDVVIRNINEDMKMNFYNIHGQLLKSKDINNKEQEIIHLDISNYPDGLYFVELISNSAITTKKLIKQ